MKNKVIIMSVVLLLLVCGCKTAGIFGKSAASVQSAQNKITMVDKSIADNNINKLRAISELNYGTLNALGRVTNAPVEVVVANDMAKRVETLTGLPPQDKINAVDKLVYDLIYSNKLGQIELAQRDITITALQNEESLLVKNKDIEINKALELSAKVASQNDTNQAKLNEYTKWFGLSAIFMGIKELLFTSMWVLLGAIVIFIILRALSMTNPMAAAIFGIFQSIGASIIHVIETLIPQSINTLTQAKNDVTKLSNFVDNSINTIETTAAQPQAPLSGSK